MSTVIFLNPYPEGQGRPKDRDKSLAVERVLLEMGHTFCPFFSFEDLINGAKRTTNEIAAIVAFSVFETCNDEEAIKVIRQIKPEVPVIIIQDSKSFFENSSEFGNSVIKIFCPDKPDMSFEKKFRDVLFSCIPTKSCGGKTLQQLQFPATP